jgi:hypothetical protein
LRLKAYARRSMIPRARCRSQRTACSEPGDVSEVSPRVLQRLVPREAGVLLEDIQRPLAAVAQLGSFAAPDDSTKPKSCNARSSCPTSAILAGPP